MGKFFREVWTRDNIQQSHNVRLAKPKSDSDTTYDRVITYLDSIQNNKVRVWRIKS